MVHYEWKCTNEKSLASQVWIDPHLLKNQFSLESYADLKKYQDNTNSGLKKFTWFLSWAHASARGGDQILLGTPATYM